MHVSIVSVDVTRHFVVVVIISAHVVDVVHAQLGSLNCNDNGLKEYLCITTFSCSIIISLARAPWSIF